MVRVRRGRHVGPQRQGLLRGEEGLVTAIIHQALVDAIDGRPDAIAYFDSWWYRHHLSILGLPEDWLPDALERV